MLKVKNAGRPKNVGKTLSDEQEAKIIRRLIDTILYYQSLEHTKFLYPKLHLYIAKEVDFLTP